MKNKFSIITVVKNDKLNVLKTINSLKLQCYKKYEHIIIDGNSNDGTSKIIRNNLSKKIRYYKEKDKNLYDAINKAILKSTGKYIILLHSGDFFYNSKTLNTINYFLQKNEDFIYGNVVFYKELNIKRIWRYTDKKLHYLNSFKIAHPSLVIKKDVLSKINYNINFKISSDTDFLIKLLKLKKLNHRHINKYFIFMLSGGLSTTYQNIPTKFIEDMIIYYNHFSYLGFFIYIYKILVKLQGFVVPRNDKNKLRIILAQNTKKLIKN